MPGSHCHEDAEGSARPKLFHPAVVLAGLCAGGLTAYGAAEDIAPRFQPAPADVSDCLTVFSWVRHLEKNESRLIWWRSFEMSFGLMGKYIGRSDETAQMPGRREFTMKHSLAFLLGKIWQTWQQLAYLNIGLGDLRAVSAAPLHWCKLQFAEAPARAPIRADAELALYTLAVQRSAIEIGSRALFHASRVQADLSSQDRFLRRLRQATSVGSGQGGKGRPSGGRK